MIEVAMKMEIEEKYILENWDLLSKETKSMLELVGVTPQNGEKVNQFQDT